MITFAQRWNIVPVLKLWWSLLSVTLAYNHSVCAGAQWRRCHRQNDDNFMRWLDIFRKKFSIVLSPHITIFVRYFIFVLKLQPSWLTLLNARRAFEQVSFRWWFSRIVRQRYSEVTQGCYLYSDGYSIIKYFFSCTLSYNWFHFKMTWYVLSSSLTSCTIKCPSSTKFLTISSSTSTYIPVGPCLYIATICSTLRLHLKASFFRSSLRFKASRYIA